MCVEQVGSCASYGVDDAFPSQCLDGSCGSELASVRQVLLCKCPWPERPSDCPLERSCPRVHEVGSLPSGEGPVISWVVDRTSSGVGMGDP